MNNEYDFEQAESNLKVNSVLDFLEFIRSDDANAADIDFFEEIFF